MLIQKTFILFKADFEELSQLMDREFSVLFKYLQGVAHIWDMHEIGLVKKERALQEILQDCRKDHDNDNQVGVTMWILTYLEYKEHILNNLTTINHLTVEHA